MKVTAPEYTGKVRVFLDGVDVTKDIFEADDEEGYVLSRKRDKKGNFAIEGKHATGDMHISVEKRTGKVRIELI